MSFKDKPDDEHLSRAVTQSLRDATNGRNEDAPHHPQHDSSQAKSPPFRLGSLNRKKMEEERLARISSKRRRTLCEDEDVMELPNPKRREILQQRLAVEAASVPFPTGAVKRTWARGYNRSSDDIKIEEVLQRDKLLLAFFSSFQWDESWLLSKIDVPRTKVLLAAFAPGESQKQQMLRNAPMNIKFCFPPMCGPGSMHSKLQLLKFSNYLRIVLASGNLVPYDWGETGVMENMVFLIDLPHKPSTDQASPPTQFFTNLQLYLQAMGVDEGLVDSLSKYDFSETADVGFVYSIPGGHKGSSFSQIGYTGLGATISRLGLATSDPVEVDIACASIGSLKYDLVQAIYRACQGHDGKTGPKPKQIGKHHGHHSDSSELQQHFRIYFPSYETIRKSRGGENAAGTICLQEKWWRAETFPAELMRDCVSTRDGLLMHSKIILVRSTNMAEGDSKKNVAWAYVGSANLSESAWGRVVKDRASGQEKIVCRNWECGVVLPVQASRRQGNGPTDMTIFHGTVPIPMQTPGRRYSQDEHPWFFQRHFNGTRG